MPFTRAALAAIAILSAMSGSHARAQDFAFAEERGGWVIVDFDYGCVMEMEYEGPGATSFSISKAYEDGQHLVTVMNGNWSSKDGEAYTIVYAIDREIYAGGDSIGTSYGGQRGFMSKVSPGFAADLARGNTLRIYLGDTQIDQLGLEGTAVAIGRLNHCTSLKAAAVAAERREKARFDHLPKDPFAPPPPPPPVPGEPTPPEVTNANAWAMRTQSNYPSQASREGLSGDVEILITVDQIGRSSACQVTRSSGHAILDEAACTSAMRYARFKPATDGKGNAINGTITRTLSYKMN